jgi:uncharacterized membrane protein
MTFYNFKINKPITYSFLIVSLAGFLDAIFLTTKYYVGTINCSAISGCQEVLGSTYSDIFGIPIALLGAAYYLLILFAALGYLKYHNKLAANILGLFPMIGLLFSLWLVYLQLFVIKYICIYCMGSALASTILFVLSIFIWKNKTNKEVL